MRKLFNREWTFCKTQLNTSYEEIKNGNYDFAKVLLPHDWAIEKYSYFYENATGWYRKSCEFEHQDDERVILYFDAIYMDSSIYVNGAKIFEWKYGYTPFEVDITDYLVDGNNEICVSVRYENPNSRWYSGAGIIRNVWVDIVPDVRIPRYGVYAHSELITNENLKNNWLLTVDTNVVSTKKDLTQDSIVVEHILIDEGTSYGSLDIENALTSPIKESVIEQSPNLYTIRKVYRIEAPKVWDVESPYVYSLKAILKGGNEEETTIGFRTIEFSPERGFILNANNIKLNGVCEHHDFGMIGGAFFEDAMERKLFRLKDMGVNSIRLAHNPVDPMVLELCDRMGILVMSEAFDMWENTKTTYDYGRFFKEWHPKDVSSWVRQDRNHPCLIMWSIGNEIYDIHQGERGREVVNELSCLVREFDPLKNAYITFCSNYMPWENAQKAACDVETVGYNYAEKYYKEHHKEHPDWVIYGSETSSIVYSRGVYHFPLDVSCMTDDDRQCSAMGNSTTSWGARSIEACVCDDRDMEFSAGQYLWSGHDYLGEPTPYHTKNSYLGIIDTAGFPKDPYFVWKSEWTDVKKSPFIYLSPYWDYNEGQIIDIRVTSNAPVVELFVNGKSQGVKELNHKPLSGKHIIADYKVPFSKGDITAVGYDENGNELIRTTRTSFKDTAKIEVKELNMATELPYYKKGSFRSYERKLCFYEVSAIDEDGNIVENASDLVNVSVTGGGRLLACDNGDSTDYADQADCVRRLFSGKLLVVVEKTSEEPINVSVTKDEKIIPVRRIDLLAKGERKLNKACTKVSVKVSIYPENATDKEVEFRITDRVGNLTGVAKIAENNYEKDGTVVVEACGDGEFNLRAYSKSSTEDIRVISVLEFSVEDMGAAYLNPYLFVAGSAFSDHVGFVSNGNERGVATARAEETVVIYKNIDFGKQGAKNMTIPIFALDYEKIDIDIYDGEWGSDNCELICPGKYDHPRMWNVYQDETFELNKRLVGVHTISFRTTEKIHIKGFSCEEYNPAYETQNAVDALRVYGDTYTVEEEMISGIGNNVTVEFGDMDFGSEGPKKVRVFGRAKGNRNTLHVRFEGPDGEIRDILECDPTNELIERSFDVANIKGKGNLQLIFLPGCDYDLKWIRFE